MTRALCRFAVCVIGHVERCVDATVAIYQRGAGGNHGSRGASSDARALDWRLSGPRVFRLGGGDRNTSSIVLNRNHNSEAWTVPAAERSLLQGYVGATSDPGRAARLPLLRIPPFPGAKVRDFDRLAGGERLGGEEVQLPALMRELRVGGTYWGPQPQLPEGAILVRKPTALRKARTLGEDRPIVVWGAAAGMNALRIETDCDPWHVLARASSLIADPDDEICAVAALLNVPTYTESERGELVRLDAETQSIVRHLAGQGPFANPFTGETMSVCEAVELCGFWRSLIDSNRDLAGGIGFAFWKRDNVAPLLWGGAAAFEFLASARDLPEGRPLAVWRSRTSAEDLCRVDDANSPVVEVEDGFLRSQGLGADCVPPLSITVDRFGAYFDPAQPSELERLLQDGAFDELLLQRARKLRTAIVEAGLGKYEHGRAVLERPAGDRRTILVPGQVEDDRSVMTGGGGLSNLELLKRVRQDAPDAYILYKPHPDVVAGHRKGAIPERTCLELADEIVGDVPVSALIEMVDEVQVNTSLTGFEALMRGKPVTTYGVPFYAGWGLTRDQGSVPARRTATRTIDELVAAALLLYPRYLDPLTGLPCPAEVVVQRLAAGEPLSASPIIMLRRLQGKLMRRFRGLMR